MHAIWIKNEPIILDILSKPNVNINHKNKHGSTALLLATEKNLTSIAVKLIKMGTETNVIDKDGDTPAKYAFKFKNKRLIEEFSKKNINIEDNDSQNMFCFFSTKCFFN